jgi:hypothetical protein
MTMDHLLMIVLACAAIGAWVHAMMRKQTPFGWKVAAPFGVLILFLYVVIEALRTRGMWVSGEAEAGWLVIAVMGLGFTVSTGGFDQKPNERQA